MKWAFLFLSCVPLAAGASLGEVKSVYLLPMAFGLDQYLASRLTSDQVLSVVADPKTADAVVADRLGPALEARLDELYPREAAPAKPAGDKEVKDAKEGEAKPEGDIVRGPSVGGMSTFGRGRGNIFVIDVKTRQVVWSTHEPPKDATTSSLNRTAERIAREMKRAVAGKTAK
jgi:hypothetical protein